MKKIFANKKDDDIFEIFATLGRNQYNLVQSGDADLEVPHNTDMYNRAGSKGLYFTCYGKKAVEELVDGLDASSIPWQEIYVGEDVLTNGLVNPIGEESHEETSGGNSR